jgi:RNA polymerase sigma factor (sigma-70 family)
MASDLPSRTSGTLTRMILSCRNGRVDNRDILISVTYERFRRLTSQMLDGFPALRGMEQTGDVLNSAMIRFYHALQEFPMDSSAHFLRLAALQIRRELIDLSRRHFGPQGLAARKEEIPGGLAAVANPEEGPSTLVEWTAFHEAVEALPECEREVVDLHWYQGLYQEEVADVIGVDVRTVRRRWRSARRSLGKVLPGHTDGGN